MAKSTRKAKRAAKSTQATTRHSGIPRTYAIAKRLGHKKAPIELSDLSARQKRSFVNLAEFGARAGSLCGVGPSSDPNYWLVCYKNASGECNWVHVPRTGASHP